jgi:hypothetical protein
MEATAPHTIVRDGSEHVSLGGLDIRVIGT